MNQKDRNQVLLIIIVLSAACLLLVCLGVLISFFFFGSVSSFSTDAPTETTTLNDGQLQHCRQTLVINETVDIEGGYYLFTPGFLDDSLECHLQVHADSVKEIFDLSVVDPTLTTNQQIAPGRYLRLTIENPEAGLFIIEGFWFET